MTTQIDSTAKFLGWPVSKLRALLKSYHVGKNSFLDYGCLAPVKLTGGAAAGLLGEALARGLIGRVDAEGDPSPDAGFSLTMAGRAVAAATALKRTRKATARKVLDRLLHNAVALSGEAAAPIKVARIWVFGSYIDPSRDDVGDLDVVIETYFTGIEGTASYTRRLAYITERYPEFLPAVFKSQLIQDPDGHFINRMLYGTRKPALLAPNDIETLTSLGCPCALFFDNAKGGIIEPEYHRRHPASHGRADHIREKLVMPGFPPMSQFRFTSPIIANLHFLRGLRTGDVETNFSQIGQVMEDKFLLETSPRRVPITMKRKLTFDTAEWIYEASMSVPQRMSVGGHAINGRHAPDNRAAFDLVHADILRLAAFRHDQMAKVHIFADVTISKTLGAWDKTLDHTLSLVGLHDHAYLGLDAFPDQYSWGVDLCFNGTGRGYIGPSTMDADDWEHMRLPFTKAEYDEWRSGLPSGAS